jgi:hypothetical protein
MCMAGREGVAGFCQQLRRECRQLHPVGVVARCEQWARDGLSIF